MIGFYICSSCYLQRSILGWCALILIYFHKLLLRLHCLISSFLKSPNKLSVFSFSCESARHTFLQNRLFDATTFNLSAHRCVQLQTTATPTQDRCWSPISYNIQDVVTFELKEKERKKNNKSNKLHLGSVSLFFCL